LTQATARVLVVDDDSDTCALIADILLEDGYDVQAFTMAEEALEALETDRFELVLADIKMPRISGVDLLREVRKRDLSTQVVLMTAFASVETAVAALRGEAFDYLVKPFPLPEFRKRVRAAVEAQSSRTRRHIVEHYRDLSIDHNARRVWVDEREVRLTKKEFDVLAQLFDNMGCAVPLEELLMKVWESDQVEERNMATVRTCVRRLRQKIGDDERQPKYIGSVWGVGYQLGD
jgi:DNA-binding response OmpR family regulator